MKEKDGLRARQDISEMMGTWKMEDGRWKVEGGD